MMILEFQSASTINTRTESTIIEITCKGGRTDMNEIIDRISEIEAASAAIIEDANQKKKEFADLMEQRMKEFDIQTETETEVQYKPKDLPKLQSAVVRQAGSTVVLVVAADYDAVAAVLGGESAAG